MATNKIVSASVILLVTSSFTLGNEAEQRVKQVAETKGLVAFWNFALMQDGQWITIGH